MAFAHLNSNFAWLDIISTCLNHSLSQSWPKNPVTWMQNARKILVEYAYFHLSKDDPKRKNWRRRKFFNHFTHPPSHHTSTGPIYSAIYSYRIFTNNSKLFLLFRAAFLLWNELPASTMPLAGIFKQSSKSYRVSCAGPQSEMNEKRISHRKWHQCRLNIVVVLDFCIFFLRI